MVVVSQVDVLFFEGDFYGCSTAECGLITGAKQTICCDGMDGEHDGFVLMLTGCDCIAFCPMLYCE